jgi:hypothetical protein
MVKALWDGRCSLRDPWHDVKGLVYGLDESGEGHRLAEVLARMTGTISPIVELHYRYKQSRAINPMSGIPYSAHPA